MGTVRSTLYQYADAYRSIDDLEREEPDLYRELAAMYWREAPIDLATEVIVEGDEELLDAFQSGDEAQLGRVISKRLLEQPRHWLNEMLHEERDSREAAADDRARFLKDLLLEQL